MSKFSRVLVDSDGIFALIVETDTNYRAAIEKQKLLSESNLIITDFVLGEVVSLISRRIGKNEANDFLNKFDDSGIKLVQATENILKTAKEYFLRQATKDTSFTDCVNMAVMNKLKLDAIFSFDRVYEKNGFKMV